MIVCSNYAGVGGGGHDDCVFQLWGWGGEA